MSARLTLCLATFLAFPCFAYTQASGLEVGISAFGGASDDDSELRGGLEANISYNDPSSAFSYRLSKVLNASHNNDEFTSGMAIGFFWDPLYHAAGQFGISGYAGAAMYFGESITCIENDGEYHKPDTATIDYCDAEDWDTEFYPEVGLRLHVSGVRLSPFFRYYVGDQDMHVTGVNLLFAF
ncbi:hypothetical protein [Veronia nyctiphanis]|nr:hypothetical protein [Veronia nyctiphanis]